MNDNQNSAQFVITNKKDMILKVSCFQLHILMLLGIQFNLFLDITNYVLQHANLWLVTCKPLAIMNMKQNPHVPEQMKILGMFN